MTPVATFTTFTALPAIAPLTARLARLLLLHGRVSCRFGWSFVDGIDRTGLAAILLARPIVTLTPPASAAATTAAMETRTAIPITQRGGQRMRLTGGLGTFFTIARWRSGFSALGLGR